MHARRILRKQEATKQSVQCRAGCARLAASLTKCSHWISQQQPRQLHVHPWQEQAHSTQHARHQACCLATDSNVSAGAMETTMEATGSANNLGAFDDRGVYRIEMAVRDYELDQFGVVNNAVYASYFQHARHEGLSALGFDCDDSARAGTPLALAELNLTFKAPLRSRDRFFVSVWVDKLTPARAVFGQRIEAVREGRTVPNQTASDGKGNRTLVAEAQAVVVWLDQQYRPSRIPAAVKAALQDLADRYQQQ